MLIFTYECKTKMSGDENGDEMEEGTLDPNVLLKFKRNPNENRDTSSTTTTTTTTYAGRTTTVSTTVFLASATALKQASPLVEHPNISTLPLPGSKVPSVRQNDPIMDKTQVNLYYMHTVTYVYHLPSIRSITNPL